MSSNRKFLANTNIQEKGNYFIYRKIGHYIVNCYIAGTSKKGKTRWKGAKEEIIAILMEFEANIEMGSKAYHSGCMKHICRNKNAFTIYTPIKEGIKNLYMEDS